MNDKELEELIGGLTQELRRGTIVIGVLSQLSKATYGYSLVSMLEEKGVQVDPGTLYPLLRRLEKQGLLESRWDTNEARPRKYYALSGAGRIVYERLCGEWRRIAEGINGMINANEGVDPNERERND